MTVRPSSRRTCGCVMVSPSSTSMSYSWTEESTVTSWTRRSPERRTRWPISQAAIGSTPSVAKTSVRSIGASCGPRKSRYCSATAAGANRSSYRSRARAPNCSLGRVRRELAQPLGQFVDVAERDDVAAAAVLDRLARAEVEVVGHGGAPLVHRLEQRVREPLGQRGHQDDV